MRAVRICITTGDLFSLFFGSFYSSVAVQVLLRDSSLGMTRMPNPITGPNAGGPREFPIPKSLAARVGQFCR